MSKYFVITAACIALLAAPAVAATSNASVAHNHIQTAAKSVVHTRNAARRHHRDRLATKSSTRGDGEVRALNALEAAGYRQFNNLHVQGANFVATASKAGKSYTVTVMPSGSIQANKA